MTDAEKIAEFRSRFAAVLKDLTENGRKDPEAMWLIGSLVDRIVVSAKTEDWPSLKRGLTKEGYDALLKTFETQGNDLHQKGNDKAAYAVQVAAVSLIASKMDDPHITAGDELMDEFIGQTVRVYRNKSSQTATTKPN